MGHFLLDVLRRNRLLLEVVLALPYLPAVFMPLVTGLVTALMIGTWFLTRPGTSREIFQLPLSRKQLWRTRWILAFTVPLLHLFGRLARLGIAAASRREAAFTLSWVLLIFLYQLSTLGILALLYPIRPRVSKPRRPRFQDYVFYAMYQAGNIGVAFFAMAAAGRLESPAYRQMAEWPAGVPLLIAVGLCAAAISFFHSPQIVPRSWAQSPRESKVGNKARPLTKSWVTGPALFVWTQIRSSVLTAMINGSLYIFLWWILDGLVLQRFTMFSEGPHDMAFILLLGMSIGRSKGYLPGTDSLGFRHLRVLPLSTRTLAVVFTLLSVLFCLGSWVVPVAAYRIMSGHLPWAWALRLEWLSVLAGLSGLLDSVELNAEGTPARVLSLGLLFIPFGFSAHYQSGSLSSAMTGLIGLLGLAGIAASILLNARALLRSSSIYKPVCRLSSVAQRRWISE